MWSVAASRLCPDPAVGDGLDFAACPNDGEAPAQALKSLPILELGRPVSDLSEHPGS